MSKERSHSLNTARRSAPQRLILEHDLASPISPKPLSANRYIYYPNGRPTEPTSSSSSVDKVPLASPHVVATYTTIRDSSQLSAIMLNAITNKLNSNPTSNQNDSQRQKNKIVYVKSNSLQPQPALSKMASNDFAIKRVMSDTLRHDISSLSNTPRGTIYLNIYNLQNVSNMFNTLAAMVGAGAYHAGVEIYGYEYSYGYTRGNGTGVVKSFPRYHPSHDYRKTISMGPSPYSITEVHDIVEDLKKKWLGKDYDLLKNNCLNFARAMTLALGGGEIPSWVMGLQDKVNWARSSFKKVEGMMRFNSSSSAGSRR